MSDSDLKLPTARPDVPVVGLPVRSAAAFAALAAVVLLAAGLTTGTAGGALLWVGLAMVVAAAVVGWLLARRLADRLDRLAAVTERAGARTLDPEIPEDGADEVGRLAAALESLFGRLEHERQATRQRAQELAHELRTPLTSLRTNTEMLDRLGALGSATRAQLIADVQSEARELATLVEGLTEPDPSGDAPTGTQDAETVVDLDQLARRAAERARRRSGRPVQVQGDGSLVRGRPARLERAVDNLLDNATKFDAGFGGPSGVPLDPIEVQVHEGTVTVADHGAGIHPDDAPHVFDRFYRAGSARGLPGAGIGLAIVRDVATAHGGTVFTRSRAGGGAIVGFTVAAARLLPDSLPDPVAGERTPAR